MVLEAIEKRKPDEAVSIEILIEAHFDEIYRFASRRLRREDAEDATAETFQAAHAHLHRLNGGDPRLWLLGIARRKVANHLRWSFRRREEPIERDIAAPQGKDPVMNEAEAEVRKIVLALPADQRDALLLQHLEGLSVAQIAQVMHKTESSVNNLLYRARQTAYKRGKNYFAPTKENL